MKKKLFLMTCMFSLLISVVSCSDDENESNNNIPRQPQSNEIKVIFNVSSDNSEALFYISGNYTIDWGDGRKSSTGDEDDNYAIKHQYGKNKEYIITIITNGNLDFFKNFAANGLSDFAEDRIPMYDEIIIGSDIRIENLYMQTSGIKKFSAENGQSIEQANLLLGATNWDLSMVDAKSLSVYIPYNHDLDIKNLTTKHLSIIVKNEINNLSVTACDNLETLAISTKVFTKATINNLSIIGLPNLNDLRLYYLTGKDAKLTDLPKLELTLLNAVYYETIDMANTVKSSIEMSLKAYGISVLKSLKLSNQLSTLEIDNREFELATDIGTIDFSVCPQLAHIDINNLKNLYNIKFGSDNLKLDKVILKNVSSLNSLDFSPCKNIKHIEIAYATSLSNVKFSITNQILSDAKFQNTNFTEASCINMINTLPNFPIPNIPAVNRRRLSIRNNTPNLKDNEQITEAVKSLRPNWVSFVE